MSQILEVGPDTPPPPVTVEGVTQRLDDVAHELAGRLEDKYIAGRKLSHALSCGAERHDVMHQAGVLYGLSIALAALTGRFTEDVYNELRPKC
jgi:hypothetical protein